MPESAIQITEAALRSPLAHLSPTVARSGAGLQVAEWPHLGYIVLRGRADDAAFMNGVAQVLGSPLSTKPRSAMPCRAGLVLWQSPDEWWLLCSRADRDDLVHALEAQLAGCFAQVVDNSGGYTTLRISGAQHMRLLAHLSPYDFDALPLGACVSTVFSKAGVTVLRSDDQGVSLVFRRSFADYVWKLIERNARPYGLAIVERGQCIDPLLSPLVQDAGAATPKGEAQRV